MHFAHGEYLNLLWGLPLVGAFFIWSFRRRRKRLEQFVARAAVPNLTEEFSQPKAVLKALLLFGFLTFSILSLARPQWGTVLETVRRQGVDIILALDTSYSMNAEDVAPSRLEKAKREIRAFITKLRGDRVGLVAFAGMAVVQCPLTLDHGALNLFLDVINTEIIPEPGTALAPAIETAVSAFVVKERKYKILILFTDGEDLGGDIPAAVEKAKADGVMIYTVGIGTPEGRPIPVRDENGDIVEYRKDSNGQVVLSRLDERTLAQIAEETGGRYFRATTSESELETIYDEVSRQEKKELESRLFQNFEDRFQYPLGFAIFCLAAELWISQRRTARQLWIRGLWAPKVAIACALVLLAGALTAEAASVASKNKEGNRLYEQGKYEEALKAYLEAHAEERDRPELLYNLGNTLIKQKKYEQALQPLRQAASKGNRGLQAGSWFNAGNALFEMGHFKNAAQAYIESLRLNPADRDAKHNLELALKKMQEQQTQKSGNQNEPKSQPADSDSSQDQGKAKEPPQPEKGNQQQQNSEAPQTPRQPVSPQSTQADRREGSFSKERAEQILDALQNQEIAEQRKLLERRSRRKATGKDW